MMMVFSCLLTTGTFHRIRIRQFAGRDGIANLAHSFISLRVFFSLFGDSFYLVGLALCSPPVSFLDYLGPFALLLFFIVEDAFVGFIVSSHIFFKTVFTLRLKARFSISSFTKLRGGFVLLASTTSFCYDLLKHVLFLVKRLCLEPVSSYILDVGLFYINRFRGFSKLFFNFSGNL